MQLLIRTSDRRQGPPPDALLEAVAAFHLDIVNELLESHVDPRKSGSVRYAEVPALQQVELEGTHAAALAKKLAQVSTGWELTLARQMMRWFSGDSKQAMDTIVAEMLLAKIKKHDREAYMALDTCFDELFVLVAMPAFCRSCRKARLLSHPVGFALTHSVADVCAGRPRRDDHDPRPPRRLPADAGCAAASSAPLLCPQAWPSQLNCGRPPLRGG